MADGGLSPLHEGTWTRSWSFGVVVVGLVKAASHSLCCCFTSCIRTSQMELVVQDSSRLLTVITDSDGQNHTQRHSTLAFTPMDLLTRTTK